MSNPYGIPQDMYEYFEDMFTKMDADKSGAATKEEFRAYCLKYEGHTFSEKELTMLMNDYDKNRDGTITKEEFYAAVKEMLG